MNPIIVQVLVGMLQLWVGAVVVIFLASRVRRDPRKRRNDFVTALGFTALIYISMRVDHFLVQHVPQTIDVWLRRTDQAV